MTYKEIEKFIRNNNIVGREELRKKSSTVYNCFRNLTEEEREFLLPLQNRARTDLITADDFRSFIEKENVTSRRDLNKRFEGVGTRFRKLLTKEEQDSILPPKIKPLYTNLKTVEDYKKFISDNAVCNRRDLSLRFPSAYYRFLKFTESEKDEILSNTYREWSSVNTKEEIKKIHRGQ